MAPKVVRDTVLSLVREGFLQQVMGPALLQVQLYQYKNFQQPAVYIPCMGTIVWAVGWAVNIVLYTVNCTYAGFSPHWLGVVGSNHHSAFFTTTHRG